MAPILLARVCTPLYAAEAAAPFGSMKVPMVVPLRSHEILWQGASRSGDRVGVGTRWRHGGSMPSGRERARVGAVLLVHGRLVDWAEDEIVAGCSDSMYYASACARLFSWFGGNIVLRRGAERERGHDKSV